MKNVPALIATFLFLILATVSAQAAVISGTITDWAEFSSTLTIGDGTNSVQTIWSQNTWDKGYFYGYGSGIVQTSEVAYANGITDIAQITDASVFSFEAGSVGPLCDADCDPSGVGDFVVMRDINTGYYGVLRIDDIAGFFPDGTLDGTWWFQTDGTGNFSVVPIPAAAWLFGSALIGLAGIKRKRASSSR